MYQHLSTAIRLLSAGVLAFALSTASHAEGQLVQLNAKYHNNPTRAVYLQLKKGTYEVRAVGAAAGAEHSAWSVWSETSCKEARGCARTVPTRFTGLHNNYYVISPLISAVKVEGKSLAPVSETPAPRMNSYFLVTDKTRAYEVVEPHVYVNEATALAGAKTSTFTLNEPGKVGFALLDLSRTSDNRGGMALQVRKLFD
ncbi:MAG: hypothetical protein KDI44_11735 [Thiothrix sp.]|nr:hypothetical protein [Thiothrix sp.]HPQ94627.1 hypothetical protein [Thiolinea sp.]